ncbi:hypothetical protein, partial [Actinoplanes sp. NPDC051411]|uniref:hypothetical protein n=1 Tax=Actinoplanes sp. NPDC051411 TaxID=3155522 RepID=UPI003413C6F2
WATSSPPPLRNFDRMPRIRSERPAFDAKFPEPAPGEQSLAGPPEGGAAEKRTSPRELSE